MLLIVFFCYGTCVGKGGNLFPLPGQKVKKKQLFYSLSYELIPSYLSIKSEKEIGPLKNPRVWMRAWNCGACREILQSSKI